MAQFQGVTLYGLDNFICADTGLYCSGQIQSEIIYYMED